MSYYCVALWSASSGAKGDILGVIRSCSAARGSPNHPLRLNVLAGSRFRWGPANARPQADAVATRQIAAYWQTILKSLKDTATLPLLAMVAWKVYCTRWLGADP
jgi:hypothetical protein